MHKSDKFCFSKSFGIVALVLLVLLFFTVAASNLTKKQTSTNSRASEISQSGSILPFKFDVSFHENDKGPDGLRIRAQGVRPDIETNKTTYLTSIGGSLVGVKISCGFGAVKPEMLTSTFDNVLPTPRTIPDSITTYCDYSEARNKREITMTYTMRYTKKVDNKIKEFTEKYANKIEIYNYSKNEDIPLSVQFLEDNYSGLTLNEKLPQTIVRTTIKTNLKEYLNGIGAELIGVMFDCDPFSPSKLNNLSSTSVGNDYSVSCDYTGKKVGDKFKMQYWVRYYDADGISKVDKIDKNIEIVSK